MELGIFSFVDNMADPHTGQRLEAGQRIRNLIEEIELAEQTGLEVFGIGEHHRHEFLASAPAVLLAAAAVRTKNIRLTSAVTVLSSDDPVRVFQQFATVDLLSGGRAEIMAGRGSFIESFPLFGYNLDDYDDLFREKLELLLRIREKERVEWEGKHRAAIPNLPVYPRPEQQPLPVWIAVGGTTQSIIRAARLGLPLALAIIGGMPAQFVSLIDLYRKQFRQAGHLETTMKVGINSMTYVADTSQQATEEFYPSYARLMTQIGKERGWPPLSRNQYDLMQAPKGSLLVGSVQEVTEKILYEYELFGHDRFLAQMGIGSLPHQQVMHAIELFGSKVAPAVRKATAR